MLSPTFHPQSDISVQEDLSLLIHNFGNGVTSRSGLPLTPAQGGLCQAGQEDGLALSWELRISSSLGYIVRPFPR